MTIGQNARKFRKEKGLSIMKVREITGLSKSTISEIENDLTSPKTETLQKLAEAYERPVSDFFDDVSSNTDELIKTYENMPDFEDAESAMKFILEQPSLMAYGGYSLKDMDKDEIVELANDLLLALRISVERRKMKK